MVYKNSYIIHVGMLLFAVACSSIALADTSTNDPLCPPEGTQIEEWDCYRSNAAGRIDHGDHPTEVAAANDSLYFVFYRVDNAYFAPESSWVRGHIDGNKVTIKNGLRLYGMGYLFSCEYWSESEYYMEGYSRRTWYARALDDDIVFDYDAERKWLHNPNHAIWMSDDGSTYYQDSSTHEWSLWPENLLNAYELTYVPEGPLTPQPPKFTYETGSDGEKYMIIRGNIFSIEGPAMHYDKLSFRIYIDGNQYPEHGFSWYYGNPTSDGWNRIWKREEYSEPFQEAYAVMVYKYEDGSEVVSTPAPIVDVSGVDEVFREDIEDIEAPVYDLSGRRVQPDRLAPGVYIRNGRKFLVR